MIDLSRVLAGPFATMLLADLGADVVKVEPPDGDETRSWGPPWWGDPADRRSAYFASVNRNKRSVVLDLRTDDGRAALRPASGDGRRPRPQLPTGDGRATWPRDRCGPPPPSAARRVDRRWLRGSRGRSSGLRPPGAGRLGADVGHRRAGRAADEGRGRAARPDRRAGVRDRRAGGARRPARVIGQRQPRRGRRDLADQRARQPPRDRSRAGAAWHRPSEHRSLSVLRGARWPSRRGGRERRPVRPPPERPPPDRCGWSLCDERAAGRRTR